MIQNTKNTERKKRINSELLKDNPHTKKTKKRRKLKKNREKSTKSGIR